MDQPAHLAPDQLRFRGGPVARRVRRFVQVPDDRPVPGALAGKGVECECQFVRAGSRCPLSQGAFPHHRAGNRRPDGHTAQPGSFRPGPLQGIEDQPREVERLHLDVGGPVGQEIGAIPGEHHQGGNHLIPGDAAGHPDDPDVAAEEPCRHVPNQGVLRIARGGAHEELSG